MVGKELVESGVVDVLFPVVGQSIQSNLVEILQCPITGETLNLLSLSDLHAINKKIQAGEIFFSDGTPLTHLASACLITQKTEIIYPVIDDIILMLPQTSIIPDEIIREKYLKHLSIDGAKKIMQEFYDFKGWVEDDTNVFIDAKKFEDLREVSREYISKGRLRIKQYISTSGEFLLDVASGPVQYTEYLTYSEKFTKRICVDFSISALRAARRQLRDKAIYILGDITTLPFKNNTMDSTVSLHTIYHVPKEEQRAAFYELHRVTKPGKNAVVVYSWGNCSLMLASMFPTYLINQVKYFYYRGLIRLKLHSPQISNNSIDTKFYFFAHQYNYITSFRKDFSLDIFSWRSVSTPFLKTYIHKYLFGKYILRIISSLEEKFPAWFGKYGQYPMIVIKK
jgi:ubiquinone/menaquinone biosynthesis C-methylase UbiE/uncharacterized protein YbaR (Trm112 family)